MKTINKSIIFAILAATLYAISTPVSKLLLQNVPPTMVAAFLYLGAGIGMGVMMLMRNRFSKGANEERLTRADFPYVVAMVALDSWEVLVLHPSFSFLFLF